MKKIKMAYFSMEFAFDDSWRNYAGGLGILAADMMYSCADLGIEAVGVSLLYHHDDDENKCFLPKEYMKKRKETIEIEIEDRKVKMAIWQKDIKGRGGHTVPVFFLSSYIPDNPRWDRDLSKNLYAADIYTRLGQEALLGIGGARALEKLGYEVDCYHMNEGHSAFLTLELLNKFKEDKDKVRSHCSFTTHTPVSAGHDYFDYDLVYSTLGYIIPEDIKELAGEDKMGMTQLALSLSKKSNSVSEKHNQVCKKMFPDCELDNVTNGMYHPRWVGESMHELYKKKFPKWQEKPEIFKKSLDKLSDQELLHARQAEKRRFVHWINAHPEYFSFNPFIKEDHFSERVLTLGFARRFVPYKRPTLIFNDLDRLREIGYKKLQLVFACRCHDQDGFCNHMKSSIEYYARIFRGQVKIALIPNYNLEIAYKLVSGCDVWLNTPVPPREASGTSGMKAALNGILNLSVLDGWWIEGLQIDNKAGWGFGEEKYYNSHDECDRNHFEELINNLKDVINCYYERQEEWIERMKRAISLAAVFNTHRVVKEYEKKMWGK